MPLFRRTSRVTDRIPTASMADIGFLLLIFFLTTTVFDEEKGLQVMLPEAGPDAEQEVSPENLLYFRIEADGSIRLRRGIGPREERVTMRQVSPVMREALARNPEVIGVIQTAPEATYEQMIDVLDGIQAAGATRFSLQPLE